MSTKLILLAGCLLLTIIIIVIVMIPSGDKNKEGFFVTPMQAYVSEETGAIRGPSILTNGILDHPYESVTEMVKKTGYAKDGSVSLGASPGNNFDKPYQNYLSFIETADEAIGGYNQPENLIKQSSYLNTSATSANNNMFTKAHSKPTKMTLNPGEHQGVIDAKYMPYRDRDQQIRKPDSVIEVPGFDINIERLGVELNEVNSSSGSVNRSRRIPTSGDTRSPTQAAVGNIISTKNGQLLINDTRGNTITTPLSNSSTEGFTQIYTKQYI